MSKTVDVGTQWTEEIQDPSEACNPPLNKCVDRRRELSQLELLPAVVHRMIIKMVGVSELKAMRLTSRTLRDIIEKEEVVFFKVWNLDEIFNDESYDESDMKRFFADVNIVKGLTFSIDNETSGDIVGFVKSIMEDHPELEAMHLVFREVTDEKLLRDILAVCGHILRGLHLIECDFEPELAALDKGSLPCLQEFNAMDVTQDFSIILNACSSTLKKLVLDYYWTDSNDDKGLIPIIDFPLLEHLELNHCYTDQELAQLTNRLVSKKGTGAKLKVLKLPCIEYESLTNVPLGLFGNLEELDLSWTKMNDLQVVDILSKVGKKLKVLILRDAEKITGECFNQLSLDSFPLLEELDLHYATSLTVPGLAQILKRLGTKIKVLVLSCCDIFDENFTIDMNSCPQLETLDLSQSSEVSETGFMQLIKQSGSRLKSLNLEGASISDESLTRFCSYSSINLKELNLGGCVQMTNDTFLLLLKQHGDSLEKLDVSKTSITGRGISELGVSLPRLKTLKMMDMILVTRRSLKEFLSACANLKKLIISPIFPKLMDELRSKGIVISHIDRI